jgi:hypothetical protein
MQQSVQSKSDLLREIDLPPEALDCLDSGETWEGEYPEHGSIAHGAVGFPKYQEERDTWIQVFIEKRITVIEGALCERFYEVDMGGCWSVLAQPEWGSDWHESVRERYSRATREKRWEQYNEWAAENGKDPLGNFSVKAREPREWILAVQEVDGAVRFQAARRPNGPYLPLDEIPDALRQFLVLDEGEIAPDVVNSYGDLQSETPDGCRAPAREFQLEEEIRFAKTHSLEDVLDEDTRLHAVQVKEPISDEERARRVQKKAKSALDADPVA